MSLKALHIVFVIASIALSFAFAGWLLSEYRAEGGVPHLIGAGLSVGFGFGLMVYGKYVLKKLQRISYL